MSADASHAAPTAPSLWRPIATVAAFSFLPIATFLNENRGEIRFEAVLVGYGLAVTAFGAAIVVLARARGTARAGERAAVVFAAGSYVLFHFPFIETVAENIGLSTTARWPVLALWLFVFAAAISIGLRISGEPMAWNFAAVAGALLLALPLTQYTRFELFSSDDDSAAAKTPAELESAEALRTPDVYFFLLDGYAGLPQMGRVVGYDNRPFVRALRKRGFDIAPSAQSAYTVTYVSMASTLSMDYPITEGEFSDAGPFFEAVRGANPVVHSFRRLGYDFAMATDISGFSCSGNDEVDICIGSGGDAERNWALLGYTPVRHLLETYDVNPLAGTLSPVEVVGDLRAERADEPVFVYTHLSTPHPPYQYTSDCSVEKPGEGSLTEWADKAGYANEVRCVNNDLLEAIDKIVAEEPDALIVLGSDHGTGFGVDLAKSPDTWGRAGLRERFAVLSAARLPQPCRRLGAPDATVNTFRIVFTCITGRSLGLLSARHFAVPYTDLPRRVSPISEAALR